MRYLFSFRLAATINVIKSINQIEVESEGERWNDMVGGHAVIHKNVISVLQKPLIQLCGSLI